MAKEFGLIIPGKNKPVLKQTPLKKPSIFEDDSDDEAEFEKPTGLTRNLKRQDRVIQQKAVEEDPTVYQYDEVYDDMDKKRKESKLSRKDLDKKPKYIGKLLDAAEKRKRENERRIERQVQREREAEGEEFKDKESFVTSAYKKKLEELKLLEEQEKREEYLETIGDVRKQGNLDGFYRHLYDQKVNLNTGSGDEGKSEVKEEKKSDEDEKKSEEEIKAEDAEPKIKQKKRRQYRKRDDSKSEESNDEENKNLEHLPSNLDADSDFSIDSESDSNDEPQTKKIKEEKTSGDETTIVPTKVTVDKVEETKENGDKEIKEEVIEEPKKPKIDIWKKRTVGKVFDEALQRYFERKSLRESG